MSRISKGRYAWVACALVLILTACSGATPSFNPTGSSRSTVHTLGHSDVVYIFKGGRDGGVPYANLLAGSNGEFYGTTNRGGGAAFCTAGCGTVFGVSPTGTEKVLYRFQGGNDGLGAEAGLSAGNGGVLFGTTDYGGGATFCDLGCGTVFELTPSGSRYTERIVYAFQGAADGAIPSGNLLIDKNGALYGTTDLGGGSTKCVGVPSAPGGCGTVFKLTPSGSKYTETILHRFQAGREGALPADGLIADTSGALYGTTQYGGGATGCTSASGTSGCGTVFKLTPSHSGYIESVLYSFRGGTSDGSQPRSALSRGNGSTKQLYGTTVNGGGSGCGGLGCGTVFEVGTSGGERVLYSFGAVSGDGVQPRDQNGLYADSNGAFYGTTPIGDSAKTRCGTVFRLTPAGSGYTESILYSFQGARRGDGCRPYASLTESAGTLYGTASEGGLRRNDGIVFQLSTTKSKQGRVLSKNHIE
jgi:hypothetical protein